MKWIFILTITCFVWQAAAGKKQDGLAITQNSIPLQPKKNATAKVKKQTATAFVLKGTVTALKKGQLYLYYTNAEEKQVKDSATVENGRFVFNGNINGPVMAGLQLKEEKIYNKNVAIFFMEPSQMTVTLVLNKFEEFRLTGSKTQNEYVILSNSKKAIQKKYKKQLDSLRTEKNHERSAEIKEHLAPYFSAMDKTDHVFFNKHPQSFVTAYLLRFHVSKLSLDSLQMYYDGLGEKLQHTVSGKDLAKEIQQLRGGSPGSIAKDFTSTDINGNKLSLSDFKGSYVLLDFWASWCMPCRKGNPHLKELYAKYKDKGIEFIGIADDDGKPDVWHNAVKKDGLPWRQILRGLDMQKRMKNEPYDTDISDKYGIQTLPTKILIDKEGKIIGRYSDEEDALDEILKSIFGN